MSDPTPVPIPAPQNFWQANQVLISGLISAIAISLQQFMGTATTPVDWKVVGFAAFLAIASWAANNLRGKGVSVVGIIGVAGYAITSVAINGTINLNQLILAFLVGLGAMVAPPPKNASYEQSATIVEAKQQGKVIEAVDKK